MTPLEAAAERRCPNCGSFDLMVLHVANAMAAYACARCNHRFAEKVAGAAPAGDPAWKREGTAGTD